MFFPVILCFINCWNIDLAAKMRSIFLVAKVVALSLVIVTGCTFYFVQGETTRGLQQPFDKTSTNPGLIALSFYSGLFSYGGWQDISFIICQLKHSFIPIYIFLRRNCLNFVVEELKDPFKYNI